jgi:hypothetical protein
MSRYIDAEALTDSMLEHYNELCEKHGDYDHYTTGYGDAIDAIENASTADVVPRAELAVRSFQDAATIYDLQKKLVAATETLRYILSDLKKKIHDRAVYPHNSHIDPYISLKAVDAIIEKEISHAKGGG